MPRIAGALRRRILERAGFTCEYCRCSEHVTGQALHIDHILPSGADTEENLCAACASCNQSKLDATHGMDPETGQTTPLFNPRLQPWSEHFEWLSSGVFIGAKTATGRATIDRLKLNRDRLVRARRAWVEAGLHPPAD